MNKNTLLLLASLFFVTTLIGCETTRGAGQDIENTGANIQEGVEKND
jgi:predicted small secreted protein